MRTSDFPKNYCHFLKAFPCLQINCYATYWGIQLFVVINHLKGHLQLFKFWLLLIVVDCSTLFSYIIIVCCCVWQDRVGSLKGGLEFLELCGFEKTEGDEFLFLPRDKVDSAVLNSAGSELNSAINNPFFGVL